MAATKCVQETTFADIKSLKANKETANSLKALRIRGCATFEEAMHGLASEDFCKAFRLHVNLFMIVVDVNEVLDQQATENVVFEDFKLDNGRPWIVQMTSTNADSVVFFRDAKFSFVNIIGKKVERPEQHSGEHHFGEVVNRMYDLGNSHLSLLDFKLTLGLIYAFESNFNHQKEERNRESLIDLKTLQKMFEQSEAQERIFSFAITMEKFDAFVVLKEVFDILESSLNRKNLAELIFNSKWDENNCWINAVMVHNSAESLRSFFEIAKTFLSVEQQRKLFMNYVHFDRNCFFVVVKNDKQGESFSTLTDIAKEILTKDEIKSMLTEHTNFNILFYLIEYGNENTIDAQFEVLKNFLSHEEIMDLMIDVNYAFNNCLHFAAEQSSGKFFQSLFGILKTFIPSHKRRELFISRGHNRENIFHCAFLNAHDDFVLIFLEIAKEFLTTDEIKSMLIEESGSTIFQILANPANEKTLKSQFEVLQLCLSAEEIAEMITYDIYFWHYLLEPTNSSLVKFLKPFVETTKFFTTLEKQKEFFRMRDYKQENIFFWNWNSHVGQNGEALMTLIEIATEMITKQEIKSMLAENNRGSSNIISLLLTHASDFEENFKGPFETLRTFFDAKEIIKMLFGQKGYEENCLFDVVNYNSTEFVRSFFDFAKTFLSLKQQRKFFCMRSRNGKNILLSASYLHDRKFLTLIEIANELFSNNEIKSMLSEDVYGQSKIFSSLVMHGNEDALEEYFDIMRRFFKDKEIGRMLFHKNKCDDNRLHQVVEHSSANHLRSFHKIAKTFISAVRFKELFTTTGPYGRNIFLLAYLHNDKQDVFKALLEIAEEILTKDEIKSMLKERDTNGSNILNIRNQHRNLSVVFEVLKNYLDIAEIREMIVAVDEKGKSFITIAAFGDIWSLKKIIEDSRPFLTIEQQKEIFSVRSRKGKNIFVRNLQEMQPDNLEGVFSSLIESAKLVCTNEEIISMLIEKDDSGSNVLFEWLYDRDESAIKDFFSFLWDCMTEEEFFGWAFDFIQSNKIHQYGVICEIVRTSSLIESRRKLFEMGNQFRPNVFLHTLETRKLTTLVEIAREIFSDEEIKTMLMEKNGDGQNLLSVAIRYDDIDFLKELFEVFDSCLSHEEISEMIFAVDNDGDCGFYKAARYRSSQFLRSFFKYSQRFLSVEDQRRMFTMRGRNVRNVFHCASAGFDSASKLSKFIDIASGIFSDVEIKSMLTQVLDDGTNIIARASVRNNENVMKSSVKLLFENLRNFINDEEIFEMILAVDFIGEYFGLYIAAIDGFAKKFLSAEKRREIFKMRSRKGNVLLRAMDEDNRTEFSYLLRIAKEILTDDELKLMLTGKNDDGSSVVSRSVKFHKHKKEFNELLEVLTTFLSSHEISEMALADSNSTELRLLLTKNFFGRKI